MRALPVPTSAQDAKDLAADVLTFLAHDPERLARFFILTGLRADTVRAASRAPWFTASVLDYVPADETLLLAFASAAEIKFEELAQVRPASTGLRRDRNESEPRHPRSCTPRTWRGGLEPHRAKGHRSARW
jgi:hypothetical protein